MTRICWWFVERVCRLLDSAEEEVVRGDLAERGARGGEALCDVLGLVMRRQVALWLDWRPWLAMLSIVVPIGFLLSCISRWWAAVSATYAFLYINNWTWAHLGSTGARHLLVAVTLRFFLLPSVALIGWSWTSGFVLVSISRRTLWLTAPLFMVLVIAAISGEIVPASPTRDAIFSPSAAVFSLPFYRMVLPTLMRVALVLLPAMAGVCWSRRGALPLVPAIGGVIVIASLTLWSASALQSSLTFVQHDISRAPWAGLLRPSIGLTMMWPATFMVITAIRQRCRNLIHNGV